MDKDAKSRESLDKEFIDAAWASLMNFDLRQPNNIAPPEKPKPEPLDVERGRKTVEVASGKVPAPEPLILAARPPERLDPEVEVDQLKAVREEYDVSPEEEISDEELIKQRKQKLMKFIMKGNPEIFEQPDVEVEADEQEKVLDFIKNGGLRADDWQDIIGSVKRPVDTESADEIFDGIKDDYYAQRVLARISGLGFGRAGEVSGKQIEHLANNCKTPISYEFLTSFFMKTMKDMLKPEQYEKYQEAADKVERMVYGEQKDYWDVAQDLIEEAKK